MDLVRDVLDKKLMDRDGLPMGRVDGLVMHVGERSQPRVTHLEIGGATLWGRLHPSFERIAMRLARRWGPKKPGPVRIPWSHVETVGRDIKLDVEAKETGAIAWEIWIARHIIGHIPGSGHRGAGNGD